MEMSLWEDEAGPRAAPRAEVPEASARAGDEARWRSQVVTAPIEGLARAGAYAGDPGARYDGRYDLRRLAHRAIDAVVASMGFARELSDADLLAGLAAAAAAMAPGADPAEWGAVADFVYGHLLNAPDEFAKFRFEGIDAAGRRRPFEFQLLLPRVADAGVALSASPEAINVFLKAFDLDVTDAEVAVAVMLERQIADGRFEAAAATAEAAGRISVAAAARVTEILDDTRRDVGSVDWRGDARDELARALAHVSSRVIEDDRLLAHVDAGTDAEDEGVRAAAGDIAELLSRTKRLHLALEERLVRAHRTFLDAQGAQRLARRVRLRLLSPNEQLFVPVLSLPARSAALVTDAFAAAALGPAAPRVPWLSGLIDALLAPARAAEPAPREAEEPEVAEEPDVQAYADAATAAARALFAAAEAAPVRLSGLLAAARAQGDPEVLELVWLGALWAFAPDLPADGEIDLPPLSAELTGALAADDDGTALDDPGFGGADLLLGLPSALWPEPAAAVEPAAPVSLHEWRERRDDDR